MFQQQRSIYKEKFIHDVNIMAFFFHIGSKKKTTFNLRFTPMERVVSNTIATIFWPGDSFGSLDVCWPVPCFPIKCDVFQRYLVQMPVLASPLCFAKKLASKNTSSKDDST